MAEKIYSTGPIVVSSSKGFILVTDRATGITCKADNFADATHTLATLIRAYRAKEKESEDYRKAEAFQSAQSALEAMSRQISLCNVTWSTSLACAPLVLNPKAAAIKIL